MSIRINLASYISVVLRCLLHVIQRLSGWVHRRALSIHRGNAFKGVQLSFSVFQNPRDLVQGDLPEKREPCKSPEVLKLKYNFCVILRNRNHKLASKISQNSEIDPHENVSAISTVPPGFWSAPRPPLEILTNRFHIPDGSPRLVYSKSSV